MQQDDAAIGISPFDFLVFQIHPSGGCTDDSNFVP